MKPVDLIPASACREAREWAATQTGTPKQAWNSCLRGDWLLWLAHHFGVERRLLILSASDCAASVIDLIEPDSVLASVWAIDSARRFARGEADAEECQSAAYAAAAVYAAVAVADAVADAAAVARTEKRAECARLVRKHIPWSVIEAAIAARTEKP